MIVLLPDLRYGQHLWLPDAEHVEVRRNGDNSFSYRPTRNLLRFFFIFHLQRSEVVLFAPFHIKPCIAVICCDDFCKSMIETSR